MELITPLKSIAHDVNDLCQAYTFREAISLTINNSTLYTLEGLVSRQTIALVICNMKYSMVGVYECIAQSSMGEATSGPQISIDIVPSASSPSHNNNMLVPYLIMGCVLISVLLLVAILVIVIAHFWLRYQSKRLKSSGTVVHRKREENIYFDTHPRTTKEH